VYKFLKRKSKKFKKVLRTRQLVYIKAGCTQSAFRAVFPCRKYIARDLAKGSCIQQATNVRQCSACGIAT